MRMKSRLLTTLASAGLITAVFTGAEAAAAPASQQQQRAAAINCGFNIWEQTFGNCRHWPQSVDITYVWGTGPGGKPTYTTVNYCIGMRTTKNLARPDLGMAQAATTLGRC